MLIIFVVILVHCGHPLYVCPFSLLFHVVMLALWPVQRLPSSLSIFFLHLLLYCWVLHQEIGVRFRASKTASRKHAYIILTPLKPHFYIVKLGFTGVYIIFLISAQNIDCGYSLEPPRRGGSNEYPQSKYEKYQKNLSENFHFLVVKFSIYLNRHVFVMGLCPAPSPKRFLLTVPRRFLCCG